MFGKSKVGKHHKAGKRRRLKWVAILAVVLSTATTLLAPASRARMGARCAEIEQRQAEGGPGPGLAALLCPLGTDPDPVPDYAGARASTTPLDPPTTAAGGPVGEQAAP